MPSICLCFEVHQPMRLKHYPGSTDGLKDEQLTEHYLNNGLNKFVFDRATKKCYWPTMQILLDHVDTFKKEKRKFKFTFNFSGVWVEQCEKWQPDMLDVLKQLANSGMVEFLGSTYYHSLAGLFNSREEFVEQVKLQNQLMKDLLKIEPKVFVNTEMLYNNLIAKSVEDLGYKAIFTEGVDRVLGWRSPNYVYARGPVSERDKPLNERIRVLLRNYRLSDDIGYRFSSKTWDQWPLTAEKYSIWASSTPGQIINLFMDFETFGEHHPEETGIFYFLKALPWKFFDWKNLEFTTPSEILQSNQPVGEVDVHEFNTVSWADMERDTSAWLGNSMQQMTFEELKKLEPLVKHNGKRRLLGLWRLLQQSDHLYYMCTKWWGDGDVHKYFSPFSTPHDGFINIVSAISDIKVRIAKELGKIEAIKINEKNEKNMKKEFMAIKKLGRSMKNKLTPETTVKFEEEILKPETGLIQTKTNNIENILGESVDYPDVKVDFDDLQRASSELRKRVK